MKNKLICIVGTNASGKSGLGIELALKFGGEIVSADSRQVYRGLDLGSGKVTEEEMKGVPHFMLDVAEPNENFSLSLYQEMAYRCIDDIALRGSRPFLVGGTGLYVNAVADGYVLSAAEPEPGLRSRVESMDFEELKELVRRAEPETFAAMDPMNRRRFERAAEKVIMGVPINNPSEKRYDTLLVGVTWPREILYKRIEERLDRRLEQGMIEEVENLIRDGATDDFLYRLGLEYRYILLYLRGRYASKEEFREELFKEIRHLAKEQMTWFRKRKDITWIDMQKDPLAEASALIGKFIEE